MAPSMFVIVALVTTFHLHIACGAAPTKEVIAINDLNTWRGGLSVKGMQTLADQKDVAATTDALKAAATACTPKVDAATLYVSIATTGTTKDAAKMKEALEALKPDASVNKYQGCPTDAAKQVKCQAYFLLAQPTINKAAAVFLTCTADGDEKTYAIAFQLDPQPADGWQSKELEIITTHAQLLKDLNKWRQEMNKDLKDLVKDNALETTAKTQANKECSETDAQVGEDDIVRILFDGKKELKNENILFAALKDAARKGDTGSYAECADDACKNYYLLTDKGYTKAGIAYTTCKDGTKTFAIFVLNPKQGNLKAPEPKTTPAPGSPASFLQAINKWRGELLAVAMNELYESEDVKNKAETSAKACNAENKLEDDIRVITLVQNSVTKEIVGEAITTQLTAYKTAAKGKTSLSACKENADCKNFFYLSFPSYENGAVYYKSDCADSKMAISFAVYKGVGDDQYKALTKAGTNREQCNCLQERNCEEKPAKGAVTSRLCTKGMTTTQKPGDTTTSGSSSIYAETVKMIVGAVSLFTISLVY